MNRVTIRIGLPRREGSLINDAFFTKTWPMAHRNPLKRQIIPHTGDKCFELVVVSEGKNDWCISFESETHICYKANCTCVIAQKEVHISCHGKGIVNVPSRNSQQVLDTFVSALLKDGWTDEENHFAHLNPE